MPNDAQQRRRRRLEAVGTSRTPDPRSALCLPSMDLRRHQQGRTPSPTPTTKDPLMNNSPYLDRMKAILRHPELADADTHMSQPRFVFGTTGTLQRGPAFTEHALFTELQRSVKKSAVSLKASMPKLDFSKSISPPTSPTNADGSQSLIAVSSPNSEPPPSYSPPREPSVKVPIPSLRAPPPQPAEERDASEETTKPPTAPEPAPPTTDGAVPDKLAESLGSSSGSEYEAWPPAQAGLKPPERPSVLRMNTEHMFATPVKKRRNPGPAARVMPATAAYHELVANVRRPSPDCQQPNDTQKSATAHAEEDPAHFVLSLPQKPLFVATNAKMTDSTMAESLMRKANSMLHLGVHKQKAVTKEIPSASNSQILSRSQQGRPATIICFEVVSSAVHNAIQSAGRDREHVDFRLMESDVYALMGAHRTCVKCETTKVSGSWFGLVYPRPATTKDQLAKAVQTLLWTANCGDRPVWLVSARCVETTTLLPSPKKESPRGLDTLGPEELELDYNMSKQPQRMSVRERRTSLKRDRRESMKKGRRMSLLRGVSADVVYSEGESTTSASGDEYFELAAQAITAAFAPIDQPDGPSPPSAESALGGRSPIDVPSADGAATATESDGATGDASQPFVPVDTRQCAACMFARPKFICTTCHKAFCRQCNESVHGRSALTHDVSPMISGTAAIMEQRAKERKALSDARLPSSSASPRSRGSVGMSPRGVRSGSKLNDDAGVPRRVSSQRLPQRLEGRSMSSGFVCGSQDTSPSASPNASPDASPRQRVKRKESQPAMSSSQRDTVPPPQGTVQRVASRGAAAPAASPRGGHGSTASVTAAMSSASPRGGAMSPRTVSVASPRGGARVRRTNSSTPPGSPRGRSKVQAQKAAALKKSDSKRRRKIVREANGGDNKAMEKWLEQREDCVRHCLLIAVTAFEDAWAAPAPQCLDDANTLKAYLQKMDYLVDVMSPDAEEEHMRPTLENVKSIVKLSLSAVGHRSRPLMVFVFSRGAVGESTATSFGHMLMMQDTKVADMKTTCLTSEVLESQTDRYGNPPITFIDAWPMPCAPFAVSTPGLAFGSISTGLPDAYGLRSVYPKYAGGMLSYYLFRILEGKSCSFAPDHGNVTLTLGDAVSFIGFKLEGKGCATEIQGENLSARPSTNNLADALTATPPDGKAFSPVLFQLSDITDKKLAKARRVETDTNVRMNVKVLLRLGELDAPDSHGVLSHGSEFARSVEALKYIATSTIQKFVRKRDKFSVQQTRSSKQLSVAKKQRVGIPIHCISVLPTKANVVCELVSPLELMNSQTLKGKLEKAMWMIFAQTKVVARSSAFTKFTQEYTNGTVTIHAGCPSTYDVLAAIACNGSLDIPVQLRNSFTSAILTLTGSQRHRRRLDKAMRLGLLRQSFHIQGITLDTHPEKHHYFASKMQAIARRFMVRKVFGAQEEIFAEEDRKRGYNMKSVATQGQRLYREFFNKLFTLFSMKELSARNFLSMQEDLAREKNLNFGTFHIQASEQAMRTRITNLWRPAQLQVRETVLRFTLLSRCHKACWNVFLMHQTQIRAAWTRYYIVFEAYREMLILRNTPIFRPFMVRTRLLRPRPPSTDFTFAPAKVQLGGDVIMRPVLEDNLAMEED